SSEPALAVTSGTWLNRGIWYAECDAVTLFRAWQKPDMFLAANDPAVTAKASFYPTSIPPLNTQKFDTNRELILQSAHPGEDAAVRTTLGRFLFRDDENRDHSLEFSAYTNGNWVEHPSVDGVQPNTMFTTFLVGGNNRSFNQATSESVFYTSELNDF